jgi:Arc/MetJ-type ribon-helix-helix transcriptional regulator
LFIVPTPKAKVALTLDAELLEEVDALVAQRKFRNRSQAVEAALADKVRRLKRTRLARECAKADPAEDRLPSRAPARSIRGASVPPAAIAAATARDPDP